MRLLILTQAVDLDDPVLGFFHRWLEEFSKRAESIETICLIEGKHALPTNVRVHSLGKERGRPRFIPRLVYAFRFFALAWRLRRRYDAVFVHMNEEYVLLFGLVWRLLGKRVVLWRNFKTGSWMTPLACRLADTVCYTSPDSFTQRYAHAVQMPIGIDTDFFRPAEAPAEPRTVLFFGRLDAVKRPDLFLSALESLSHHRVPYEAHLVGDPTPGNEAYAEGLKRQQRPHVSFHPSVTNREAPQVYHEHAVYANLTPSGSFDKTIGEAMACGCMIVTCNSAVRDVLPPALFLADATGESAAQALGAALALPEDECAQIAARQRSFIEREHSLALLADRLVTELCAGAPRV
jgi:glycosyltransferase involved in cell wall biosynthesis